MRFRLQSWPVFLPLFISMACLLPAQEKGPTVANANAGFSYSAPADWSLQRIPNIQYPVAIGTPVQGFSPNINIVRDDFNGSLADYVAENKKVFEKAFPKATERSESRFVTASGLKGIKWVVKDTQETKPLRQILYFFAGKPGSMIVVTCSALASDGQSTEAFFDATMKTFTVTLN